MASNISNDIDVFAVKQENYKKKHYNFPKLKL